MSDVAVTWAKAQTCRTRAGKPDRNAKQVLVHMASYADAAGEAWVLVSVLALEMDVDERTVERGRKALVEAGLLIKTAQTRVHRGRVVPIYRLPLELGHASTVRRLYAEREAELSRGDTGVAPSEAPGRHGCRPTPDTRVAPRGDTGVAQIGKEILQDKTHRAGAREGERVSGEDAVPTEAFEAALTAWAGKAPERASRVRAWPAWVAAVERSGLGEDDLLRAVLAAVARDPDFGRGKAMNLDRWLTESRFEAWLIREGVAAPVSSAGRAPVGRWAGPDAVREAVAAALGGEAAVVSTLDPAGWDGERRVIVAASRWASDRLSRDAGAALRALGVGVELKSSTPSTERMTA